eukprot:3917706-Pyramimonas_sp.AAC.1
MWLSDVAVRCPTSGWEGTAVRCGCQMWLSDVAVRRCPPQMWVSDVAVRCGASAPSSVMGWDVRCGASAPSARS